MLHAIAAHATPELSTSPVPQTWSPNIIQAVILGFVQGLTEFLPISSTAHLKVVPEVLGWGDPGVTFTAVIQLGSIAAVLSYFWTDLVQVATGSLRAIRTKEYETPEFRLALGIGLGTLPIVVGGLLIKSVLGDFYETTIRTLSVIAVVSIVMGLLLGFAEQVCPHKRHFEELTMQDGIWMGMAQAVALIPGVSRSGSTITAGLFLGLERATAARFSFLLGIPAITLAGLVELKDAFDNIAAMEWMPLIAGTLSAAIFSYLSISWLLRYLQTQNTWVFVWYRVIFGIAILAAIGSGILRNT